MRKLILFVVLAVGAGAQKLTPHPAPILHWNWRESQELVASTQSLATFKEISEPERAKLLNALAEQFKGEAQPNERAAKTRIKFLDLNGDGVPEAICQSFDTESCSPTGNCSFWIFQKSGTGYKLLLSKRAIQTFTIQNGQTSGYYDVVLGMHGSATEQGLTVYQFRDGRYR